MHPGNITASWTYYCILDILLHPGHITASWTYLSNNSQYFQIAIALYGVGLGILTISWILSICSCCKESICGKNIFLILTHLITLSCTYIVIVNVPQLLLWVKPSPYVSKGRWLEAGPYPGFPL